MGFAIANEIGTVMTTNTRQIPESNTSKTLHPRRRVVSLDNRDSVCASDYKEHLTRRIQLAENLCERFALSHLIIGSGSIVRHFQDDLEYPFKASAHFKHWVPLTQSPESYVLFKPGQKPILFVYQPNDIWRAWPGLECADWYIESLLANEFELIQSSDKEDLWQLVRPVHHEQIAFVGPTECVPSDVQIDLVNDARVLAFLNYYRAMKSRYEIGCMTRANLIAAKGHLAARCVFQRGGSGSEIFLAYVDATFSGQTDAPYDPIVAINEDAAILHYQRKSQRLPLEGARSLLIDAGATFAGYASDVTRTYSLKDDAFRQLVGEFDSVQQRLVSAVRPGVSFDTINRESKRAVARFMEDHCLIRTSAESLCETGLIEKFYPHSLGHFIGLQVHDSGIAISDDTGRAVKRLERKLGAGMVLTVEPGLYFIEPHLAELRAGSNASLFNWKEIDRFAPYGGMRVEDNIVVTEFGNRNLTREAFESVN